MNKTNLTPFHESFFKELNFVKDGLKKFAEDDDSVFATRFRIESRPLLSLIKMTVIPEKHLQEVAEKLKKFYQDFKEIPLQPKSTDLFDEEIFNEAIGLIDKYFNEAIESIEGRVKPEPKEK